MRGEEIREQEKRLEEIRGDQRREQEKRLEEKVIRRGLEEGGD